MDGYEKEKGKIRTTDFQWITSLKITEKNAEKMAGIGRLRWKIENEGFNRQKNWSGDICHACSWNANALKNHYLIYQIADFVPAKSANKKSSRNLKNFEKFIQVEWKV